MNGKTTSKALASRLLYTMLRVGDLERTLEFYCDNLGMREFKRETFTEGRFTLVFIGYNDSSPNALIELTYNWDDDEYQHGTGYGHVALEVDDIYETCKRLEQNDVRIVRAPGPMMHAPDETGHREVIAFIEDPDGYKVELIQKETQL